MHLDQNEKSVMYGVTHVVAIDDHSRFITGAYTIPVKKNLVISGEVFRKVVMSYGMFDQIRADNGREFYLRLGMQELHKELRRNQNISSYRQTQSRKNLPIEQFWPEVNNRVNYPIKRILIEMDNNQIINMEDEVVKYCITAVSCMVSSCGLRQLVSS